MKSIRYCGILAALTAALLLLAGCTEVYEPSAVLYATEAGLEKESDGSYRITVRIGDELYHACGSSFQSAADALDRQSGGRVLLKTVRVWLLSEALQSHETTRFFEELLLHREPLLQSYILTALSPVSDLLHAEKRAGQLAAMVKNSRDAAHLQLLTVLSLLAQGESLPVSDAVRIADGELLFIPAGDRHDIQSEIHCKIYRQGLLHISCSFSRKDAFVKQDAV